MVVPAASDVIALDTCAQIGTVTSFPVIRQADVRDLAGMQKVWNAARATVPHLIEAGRGGCLVFTSSLAGAAIK